MTTESSYIRLSKINVNDKIEKKNGLSYLSWAWALDQLFRADPDAEWEYGPPTTYGGDTVMVHCTVTAFGKKRTAHLPVMDYKNRAIPQPNAFEVNTAMQRALVKAIALHGLGLYIYAGEDLPTADTLPDREPPIGKGTVGNPLSEMKADALRALNPGDRECALRLAADLEALVEEGRKEEAQQMYDEHLKGVRAYDAKHETDKAMTMELALSAILGSKARSALKSKPTARA